ncbi:MAG: site-specific integrase, partial [Candidatus Margulisbacteria bacterium]|nr:site-specific integrase [Candidatus Margulisiibacteriota bacterium]
MKNHDTLIGPLIQGFFLEHLLNHKNASPQTISSYRDTFRLLLQFIHKRQKISPVSLHITDMEAPLIIAFLDHLEKERNNTIRSRNGRLAAIRSFYRWVTLCNPENIALATRVLAIPTKRTSHRIVSSLSRDEIDALLATPDLKQWQGRRDHALFSTLYNTGARVSEIICLQRDQVQFGESSFIHLLGKGRKERDVPIWKETAINLKRWFREHDESTMIAFPSARGTRVFP